MRMLRIGLAACLASTAALAQTTIYKHIDSTGRVTYSNRPMKDAFVVELEPLSTIPGIPGASLAPAKPAEKPAEARPASKPAVAVVKALPLPAAVALVDKDTQRDRDAVRRGILEDELAQEEKSLARVRQTLLDEQRNPALIAAVRLAQESADPSPARQAEMRANIDRASGRIRGLQATVAEHEKNIEALKKELGALKP